MKETKAINWLLIAVKSAYELNGPSAQAGASFWFLLHEVTRNIFTPPWMRVPIYTPGWRERHCESNVSCPRMQHNVPSQGSTQTAPSGVTCTDYEATAPSNSLLYPQSAKSLSVNPLRSCPSIALRIPTQLPIISCVIRAHIKKCRLFLYG